MILIICFQMSKVAGYTEEKHELCIKPHHTWFIIGHNTGKLVQEEATLAAFSVHMDINTNSSQVISSD
jgi:hypothetical protein